MVRGLATLVAVLFVSMAGKVSAQSIRALSYNIQYENHAAYTDPKDYWENRSDLVLGKLASENADVVSVQEMYDCGTEPNTANVIGQVRTLMLGRGYAEHHVTEACKKFRVWIFYKADRFERLSAGSFAQNDASDIRRDAPWVKLRDRRSHHVFTAIGFHAMPNDGDPTGGPSWDGPTARLSSVERLIDRARDLGDVLVMGDFNLAPPADVSTCPALLAKYERNALAATEKDPASYCLLSRAFKDVHRAAVPTVGSRIDYIWASGVFGVRSAGFSTVTKSSVWLDAVQNGVTECSGVTAACTTNGQTRTHNGVQCVCRTTPISSSDHKPLSAELRLSTVGKVGAITVVDGWYYFHFARAVDGAGRDAGEPWFCNQSADAGGHVAIVSGDMLPSAEDRDAFLETLYETVGDDSRSISLHAVENTDGRWGCLVTDMTFR